MADTKFSALTALTGAGVADNDQIPIVDTSATAGKRIDASELSVYIDGKLQPYKVGGTDVPVTDGGTGSSTASGARTNLGLVIGTDVQAYHARLAELAGISFSQGDIVYFNGTNLVRLAAGTNGQYLQTQGAGANPQWATVSGGGGSVATDSIFDAKGDLPVGTGSDTASKLTVGTNGRALIARSSESTGLYYADVSPYRARKGNGAWHFCPWIVAVSGTAWPIINRGYYTPFFFGQEVTVSALSMNVTAAGTAGNVVRLALYTSNETTNMPATVLEQGTVAGDSTGYKTYTFAANQTVSGLVWVWVAPQGSTSPGSAHLAGLNGFGLIGCDYDTASSWGGMTTAIAYYTSSSTTAADDPTVALEGANRTCHVALRIV